MAEEDSHSGNWKQLIDDKVNEDNKTIHTSVPDSPYKTAAPDKSICRWPVIGLDIMAGIIAH